jgi:hypothetical protein
MVHAQKNPSYYVDFNMKVILKLLIQRECLSLFAKNIKTLEANADYLDFKISLCRECCILSFG